MKPKNIFQSETEILSREQLSKIIGGKEVEVIINGKKIKITVPD
ncbi:MAG: hypothetical protein QM751_06960 [Paludibacteraceae bacterium]